MSEKIPHEFSSIDPESLKDVEESMTRVVLDDLRRQNEEVIREMNKPDVMRRMAENPDLDITPVGREDLLRRADEIDEREM